MDKETIRQFFDNLAPTWDQGNQKEPAVIEEILDHARIRRGVSVLDVACGTGVLIPRYKRRGCSPIWGVDLSPEMIKAARSKFSYPDVQFFLADAESFHPDRKFDRIMIYNAFPHFPYPEVLIQNLSQYLVPGGLLCVAHSMSRAMLDAHHSGSASVVSRDLIPGTELGTIMGCYLSPILCIDNDRMYEVVAENA